jgi:DNA-binding response OmpR family regulator
VTRREGRPIILNVDDDDAGRYAVNRQLRAAGFDTIEASTGEEALRLAPSGRPDLILLDIHLPDIDGFEVCRRIRQNPETASIPVLQMSASYLDVFSRVKGLNNGADGYLTKPTETPILVATIGSLLRMKRAEQRVAVAARQWELTFNAVKDGFALLDLNGNVVQANQAYYNLCSLGSEALTQIILDLIRDVRSTGERGTSEHTTGDRVLALSVDLVPEEGETQGGVVCSLADISARKLFEAQLNQAQKLKSLGVLAGGIAHDFNNLLTGVLGNASLLVDALPEDDCTHSMACEILKAGQSAALLTNQLLAYAGKGKSVTKALDLSEAVQESLPFVRRFVPKQIELTCVEEPHLPKIQADPSQIQQVVMNLIINAAESFTGRKSGTITVQTSQIVLDEAFFGAAERDLPAGEYVLLTVNDTGSGMDEATQRKIFEPFFTTKFLGRGLGLSAVHGIMTGHNGLLRLTSAPGRGTTFQLYFPAASVETGQSIKVGTIEAGYRGAGTILVVDDENTVRSFAKFALERSGFLVVTADDGKAGVALFRTMHQELRLVILDLAMPMMDGEQAFDEIRLISKSVPVILSSGYAELATSERFQGKELAGFLSKPYTAAALVSAVAKVLAPA